MKKNCQNHSNSFKKNIKIIERHFTGIRIQHIFLFPILFNFKLRQFLNLTKMKKKNKNMNAL